MAGGCYELSVRTPCYEISVLRVRMASARTFSELKEGNRRGRASSRERGLVATTSAFGGPHLIKIHFLNISEKDSELSYSGGGVWGQSYRTMSYSKGFEDNL